VQDNPYSVTVDTEAAQRLFARAGFRPTMVGTTRELNGDASRASRTAPFEQGAIGDFCNRICIDRGREAARARFNWRTSAAATSCYDVGEPKPRADAGCFEGNYQAYIEDLKKRKGADRPGKRPGA